MPVVPGGASAASPAPRRTGSLTSRLRPWLRPVLPRLLLGGLGSLGASLLALAVPQVLRWVVNGPLAGQGTVRAVVAAALVVTALGVLEAFLVWSRRALIASPGTTAEREMRTDLFDHLLDLPGTFHDRWSGGQLLSRSMSDLSMLRRWMVFGLVALLVSATTVVVGVTLMLATSWQLGLVYLVGAVPVVWLGFRFRQDYKAVARRARDQAGDLATTVEESVHGIRVLKAFGRGQDALEEFAEQAEGLRSTELVKARTLSRVTFALGTLPEVVLASCLGLGVWLAARGDVDVGDLVAFFATAAVVNAPVERLGQLLAMTMDARAAADRYFEVMGTPAALTDPDVPAPVPPARAPGTRVELVGVHVRFSTQGPGTRDVLDGVDLVVEPGETLALVGLTGSGKSTLLGLVPRLSDVAAGAVRIDGVDVRDLRRSDVRAMAAIAFEDPVLFSASVAENVLLGVRGLDEEAARGRAREALEVASADFVADLPDGIDTVIGEEGLSLSGGQRQRIALARAIATRPRVLVLDDPLSALDVATEAVVTDRLRRTLRGTTTLVVAHRPSTVALADRVAVLEDGRITGIGRHTELLAHHPHYRYVLTAQGGTDGAAAAAVREPSR